MNKITEEEILETIQDDIKISEDRITEESIEVITGMKATAEREVGVCLEKGHFQEIMVAIIEGMIGSSSNSRSRSGSRTCMNRTR